MSRHLTLRGPRVWWKLFLLTILALEVAAVPLVPYLRDRYQQPGGVTPGPSTAPPVHSNEKAGFSFTYPKSWKVTDSGSLSSVTAPNRVATISLALIPKAGSQRSALANLVTTIRSTYPKVTVSKRAPDEVGGAPAVTAAGVAHTDADSRVGFKALALKVHQRFFGIAEFWTPGAHRAHGRLADTADSFRVEG
jgi:hypothetical protein